MVKYLRRRRARSRNWSTSLRIPLALKNKKSNNNMKLDSVKIDGYDNRENEKWRLTVSFSYSRIQAIPPHTDGRHGAVLVSECVSECNHDGESYFRNPKLCLRYLYGPYLLLRSIREGLYFTPNTSLGMTHFGLLAPTKACNIFRSFFYIQIQIFFIHSLIHNFLYNYN